MSNPLVRVLVGVWLIYLPVLSCSDSQPLSSIEEPESVIEDTPEHHEESATIPSIPSPESDARTAESPNETTADPPPDPCDFCTENETCETNECIPKCVPDCDGKACGDNGCGGPCGECAETQSCLDFQCVELCGACDEETDCPSDFLCSIDPLGTTGLSYCAPPCSESSPCPLGMECTPGSSWCSVGTTITCFEGDLYAANTCGDPYWLNEACGPDLECNPDTLSCACPQSLCADRECGTNGCEGGVCGTCELAETCVDGKCCLSNCENKECGNDGCGLICGVCETGEQCNPEGVCCVPEGCEPGECGLDPNGCPCGDCGPQGSCIDGLCACSPDCEGKDCGDDGCGGSCGCCGPETHCKESVCIPENDCGGCPDGFSCSENGRCERPSVEGCWDVVLDAPLTSVGRCLDPHTVHFCEGSTEVLLRCDAPGAKRRSGDVAKGALWCGWNAIGALMDCQSGPPCPAGPCQTSSTLTGCKWDEQCQDGACIPCEETCEEDECGLNSCGSKCGSCLGSTYNGEIELTMPPQGCFDGQCACTPNCQEVELPCGPDGCGGSCGDCPDGTEWSCGDERICICTPQCEGKFCGEDSCGGRCGPLLESGAGESFLAQGLSDCPEAILCNEEFGVCGDGEFPCGSDWGLPLSPPDGLTASGTDTVTELPDNLMAWVTARVEGGPPCPTNCVGEYQFRDALLFYPIPPEPIEDSSEVFDPESWETAIVTLHFGGNPGEENWLFRYRLSGDLTISGTSFEAVWSSAPIPPEELPAAASLALLEARSGYLGEDSGEPTLEFGILTAVSWGCSFHHYKYIESKVGSLPLIAVTNPQGELTVGSPITE